MEIRNSISYTIEVNNDLKVSAWIIVDLIAKNIDPLLMFLDLSMKQRNKASLRVHLNYFQKELNLFIFPLFFLTIKTLFHLS